MNILLSLHGTSFQVYPQTNFLVTQRSTKICGHQYEITQLAWIHMLHTYNVWTFNTVAVWSFPHIPENWWVHHKIDFRNQSFHTLTSSVSMVSQNSWHILGIILYIYCPTSQKLYVLHWLEVMLQWNIIGMPLLYSWKHLIINTVESSFMISENRCIQ